MFAYTLRRLAWTALMLFFTSVVSFFLIFASPGDPARLLAPVRPGQELQNQEVIERIRVKYGFDQPVYVQYTRYMGKLLQGDWGESFYYNRPVLEVLFGKLPATASLAASIMLVAIILGIPMGIFMAYFENRAVDRSLLLIGSLTISLPGFLIALLLVFVFAFKWNLFPSSGAGGLRHLVLPTLSGALPTAVAYAFLLRTNLLSMFAEDYARTAKAKGLRQRSVVLRHILPNAVLPVVTLASIDMAALLTGIVLIEQVFSYPGIGQLTLKAVQAKDIPVVLGSVLFAGFLVGMGNLLADLIAARLDPRIRLES